MDQIATVVAATIGAVATVWSTHIARDNAVGRRSGNRTGSGGTRIIGRWLIVSVVIAAGTGALVSAAVLNQADSSTADVAPSPAIDFDRVAEGVSACPTLTGTGAIPEGQQLWIFVRAADEDHYWTDRAQRDGDRWRVRLGLGSLPGGPGSEHHLVALLVDEQLVAYLDDLSVNLSDVDDEGDPDPPRDFILGGSYEKQLPPSIAEPDHLDVTRSSEPDSACGPMP